MFNERLLSEIPVEEFISANKSSLNRRKYDFVAEVLVIVVKTQKHLGLDLEITWDWACRSGSEDMVAEVGWDSWTC